MNGRYKFKGYKEDININESISLKSICTMK